MALIRFYYFNGDGTKMDKEMTVEMYHTLKNEILLLSDIGVIKFTKEVTFV